MIPLLFQDRAQTFNEVNIIRKCSHVNIIRYKDFFITSNTSGGSVPVLSLVMEYADAGDLHARIKRQRETVKMYFEEVSNFALSWKKKNSQFNVFLLSRKSGTGSYRSPSRFSTSTRTTSSTGISKRRTSS